jgi:hypothetical protein
MDAVRVVARARGGTLMAVVIFSPGRLQWVVDLLL